MRNSFSITLATVVWILMLSPLFAERAVDIGSEKPDLLNVTDLEQAIDRVLGISRSDEVTSEEHKFVLSLPKEAIPLMTRRLEQRLKENGTGPDPFSLVTYKLKQLGGEIPDEMRRAAIDVLVATCESDDDSRLLMHLSGLRGLNDPKITEMALRMKTRTDSNIQKAAAKLLATIDSFPNLGETPAPLVATPAPAASVTATPAPSSPVPSFAESPAPVIEHKSPVWPWVVGILALVAIVAFALKRRA